MKELKENDTRGTPWGLFRKIEARLGVKFALDACTNHALAKCDRYYTLDGYCIRGLLVHSGCGLTSEWGQGQHVFCNPPFSQIEKWVEKAWAEAYKAFQANPMRSGSITMLVPNNKAEQPWWQDHVEPYRDFACTNPNGLPPDPFFSTINLPGREKFLDENGGPIYAKNKDGSFKLDSKGNKVVGSPAFGVTLLHWAW